MMNRIEDKIDNKKLPEDCELRQISGCRNQLSLVEMGNGTRLIVKNEIEILIPKSMREEMTRVLHLSHQEDMALLNQAKQKIFWPGMKRDLKKIYDDCPKCQENKTSKANEDN